LSILVLSARVVWTEISIRDSLLAIIIYWLWNLSCKKINEAAFLLTFIFYKNAAKLKKVLEYFLVS